MLEKKYILSRIQYSFRPKLGTENELCTMQQNLFMIDKSEKVKGICLDLAMMDHMEFTYNFGINKSSLKWFKF